MKPPAFKYFAPKSLDDALEQLAEYGDEAKVLAGGQSFVPIMNFRLAQPAVLIDLNGIPELFYIRSDKKNGLRIGAMTRQREVERSELIKKQAPLIHETMPFISHPQIRNRGTVGGSIAHADPAAELPAVMLALDASYRVKNKNGERVVSAREFHQGLFTTALEPDEILTQISIPPLPPRTGCAFQEVARRHGDFALVGVAAIVSLDKKNICQKAELVFLSVGDGPVEAQEAAKILSGQTLSEGVILAAAETAASKDIFPVSDIHASESFRRHLAKVLAERALTAACALAKSKTWPI
ncbi:MAG: FAD binding domain-containing protein [bacterium]